MNKEMILEKSHPLIVSSIKKYALSKGEWTDLYQEGVLHLLELLPKYDETAGVTIFAYFKSSLRYFYLNYGRYTKSHTSLNSVIDEEGGEIIDFIADDTAAFEDSIIQKQEIGLLRKAISGLEAQERELLNLVYYKAMTLEETAIQMNLNISAVFRRKEKLLKKLRNSCEKN